MGISTLPALVRTDLVLVTEEGRIAAEAGGVFGRGDPEHLQQQRLVGALPGAGRGQDDAIGRRPHRSVLDLERPFFSNCP
jgi:hypothetical protein